MGNYNISEEAQYALVGAYKFSLKHSGLKHAASYLSQTELFLEELAKRSELARDSSKMARTLKFYLLEKNEVFIIRVLGKRMNFIEDI